MTIHIEKVFNCDAEVLWSIVGTPDRVDWVPGVHACEFDGEVRRLDMPGAGQIMEKILERDEEKKFIAYSCIESPVPLNSHRATIEIQENEAGCLMIWETEVDPVAVETFIEQSMQGCLSQIETLIAV